MAIADIFQVVHNHQLFGQKLVNVYHAERANPGENAQSVADAFTNSIVGDIRAWQTDEVSNQDVVVFNLGVSTDFHTASLSGLLGLRLQSASPSFISGGIRFPSSDRDIRSGQKRYAGAEEEDYNDGQLDAGAIVLLAAIADALLADWLASSDSHHVCNFIILKRWCELEEPVTGKCLKYRLPEIDDELFFYTPTTKLVNANVTSQVSRKTF